MRSLARGYTLVEVLIVVAVVAALIGISTAYKMDDADRRLDELDFRTYYEKARSLLIYARSMHIQGFRSHGDLNIKELKEATRGSDWEVSAKRIAALLTGHAEGDFKLRFNERDIQIRFLVADDVVLRGYPVQKYEMAGDKDEVVLSVAMQIENSRLMRLNDYLAN